MTASAGGSVADASEDLGDGLLLRRARLHDAAAAADLDWIGIWARDLMERPHPTMTAGDVVVVEDTGAGRLVSTLNLIPQTWAYAGVPLGVGRVELVGTDPAYQGRGLVRRQLELVHRRSAARGHLLQVISGIPGYYHQFGYTYALAAGGGRTAWRAHVPAPAPGAAEPFRLRLAGAADLAALDEIEQHAAARSRLACVRDHAAWRYELDGRSAASALHSPLLLLEAVGHDARAPRPAGEGRIVGFAVLGNGGFPGTPPAGPIARVRRFEVAPGVSWRAATLCLLRHLTRPRCAAAPAAGPAYEEVRLALGEDHPAYAAAPGVLAQPLAGSAWYVRGPDLPALLRRVRSVLEARLAASLVAGYTGRLSLSFYRDGLRLRLERGHLAAAEAWPRAPFRAADACFPDLTFLQLLMGYRSLDELEDVSPDCRVSQPEARLVLNALFPKQPSAVWPIA